MSRQPARNTAGRPPFRNRTDAGRLLAASLTHHAAGPDVAVLGLARGGVPVARAVADATGATFGVLTARRIGVPGM